ncbi:hypothetical protein HT031_005758 [Scenedesmus sp. PABB004]|nr:hypothetical protein HT031_005758 [Scenedesmus sp. PABB004]
MKFVHLALVLSGVPLFDSGFRTFKSAQDALDRELSPNQRLTVLAKKWREERNFWIAAMAFTLWCLLTVLYAQVGHAMRIHDRLDAVQAELDELRGVPPPEPAASKLPKMSNLTSSLPGFMKGRGGGKAKAEDNSTEPAEAELTPAGPATRRRVAAAASTE